VSVLRSLRNDLVMGWTAARNLALGMNVRALGIGPRPRALAHHTTELLFLQQALLRRRGLTERSVAEHLGEHDVAVRLAPDAAKAWLDASPGYAVDLLSLCMLVHALEAPRRIFEIGTSVGTTALHFALNAPQATIFTLDLPRDHPSPPALRTTAMDDAHIRGRQGIRRYVFDGRPEAERIACLFGDSATFDFTPYEGSIDLFFIDGAHSYEYVRADKENALRCCRAGGIIAWHDFGRLGVNGVTRWLRELQRASGREIFVVPGGSLAYTVL
jgi:predicted O-methyltransferase YrrM